MDVLLEEDRAETGVESTNTLSLQDLAESANETICEGRFGNETDTGSLKRAKSDIRKELAEGGRDKVDSSSVVGGSLVAEHVDALLLEEFVSRDLSVLILLSRHL